MNGMKVGDVVTERDSMKPRNALHCFSAKQLGLSHRYCFQRGTTLAGRLLHKSAIHLVPGFIYIILENGPLEGY